MDTYSKTEIDGKLENLLLKVADIHKNTQMDVHAMRLDMQWMKWLLLASLFTIIASKFFHI